ncbi:MAG: hypothetical protein AAFW00_19695 [Bacteroidota bacterium]
MKAIKFLKQYLWDSPVLVFGLLAAILFGVFAPGFLRETFGNGSVWIVRGLLIISFFIIYFVSKWRLINQKNEELREVLSRNPSAQEALLSQHKTYYDSDLETARLDYLKDKITTLFDDSPGVLFAILAVVLSLIFSFFSNPYAETLSGVMAALALLFFWFHVYQTTPKKR